MRPMMPKTTSFAPVLLLGLCANLGTHAEAQDSSGSTPSAAELMSEAMKTIKAVDSYTGEFIKRERVKGDFDAEHTFYKFKRPFKVYMKYIDPHPGQEVLYVRGENDNEIKAHKGSFPDITVNLSPYGRAAMKGSHQPIMTFGLEVAIEIMTRIRKQAEAAGLDVYKVSDGGTVHGEPVWKIEAKLPSTGRTVKARDDENLWQLAKRVGQDMYVILHHNDEISSPKDIDEDDDVFVPDFYASRLEYLIGKNTKMLRKESSWDHQGRKYEQYDYPVLKHNAGLTDKDFDPDNEEYDF